MKTRSIYTVAAGILFSAGLAIGQTPTTQPPKGSNPRNNSINQSNGRQINSSAVPDPLRSTLQGDQQYKGWENGQWYFNPSTNQYSLQMPSSNTGSNLINPVTPATPAPSSPTSPSPTSPASPPNSPNPMGGLQTSPSSPGTTTQPAWYRFDQNGRLIPQN